jgi:hypothetical protein
MFLATQPLERVSEADLQRLIADGVREGRNLDFKRDAIGDDRDAKREFVRDVTSFANTGGGYLIVGMAEAAGVADALSGLTARPADDEKLRLENLIRDGVEPRLGGVRIHEVTLSGGGYALVIKIPASWNPPHRVALGGTNRFYARNSAGAYELSVEQLRSAFLAGTELERRIQDFQFDRLARLKSGRNGASVGGLGKFILHVIPVNPDVELLDLTLVQQEPTKFAPPRSMGFSWRYTFNGLILYTGQGAGTTVPAYTHIFRDGRVEGVRSNIVSENSSSAPSRIFHTNVSQALFGTTKNYIEGLTTLGVAPPFIVMLSLLGVLGTVLIDSQYALSSTDPVDRDDLLFEPVVIEDLNFQAGWQTIFRPVLDALWNAYGYPRCHDFFNDDGSWRQAP